MRTVRAVIRFVWSLLVTAAVLGGTAVLLIHWLGSPLPDHLPSLSQIAAFADDPLAYPVGRVMVTAVAWLFWLGLAASVAVQAWAQRSRHPMRLRLPRPLQILTASVFGIGVLNLAQPTQTQNLSTGTAAITAEDTTPPTQTTSSPPAPPPHTGASTTGNGAHTGDRDATAPSQHTGGVRLPDGWITWPTASGILATSAAALLNATHQQSASALVRAVRAARYPGVDPDSADAPVTTDDITLLEQDAATRTGLQVAVSDSGYLGLQTLPRTGVGLIGSGAVGALRGLLGAAIVASPPATVVVARDLLHRLTAATGLPKVTVVADTPAAIHHLQLAIGARYAAEASHPATEHPAMILMTDPPTDDARLTALAVLGHDLNAYIIVNGPWVGATWQVDERGHATEGSAGRGRLNQLSHRAIRELADLLQAPPPRPSATSSMAMTRSSTQPLRLCILGRPTLTASTQRANLRRSGAWQIAVYLALHPDGASRTDLIEQIFGDMKRADAAATSLHTCLHELRRALTVDDRSALLTVDGGYRLDHDRISVDWWNLQALLHHGDLATGVSLYKGPIAQGYQWDWLPEHRQTARRMVADAYALLATATDDPHEALDLALAGIAANPHAQDCYAAAIRSHLRTGNDHGAQMIYRELLRRLARSGASVSPAIASLLQGTTPAEGSRLTACAD